MEIGGRFCERKHGISLLQIFDSKIRESFRGDDVILRCRGCCERGGSDAIDRLIAKTSRLLCIVRRELSSQTFDQRQFTVELTFRCFAAVDVVRVRNYLVAYSVVRSESEHMVISVVLVAVIARLPMNIDSSACWSVTEGSE